MEEVSLKINDVGDNRHGIEYITIPVSYVTVANLWTKTLGTLGLQQGEAASVPPCWQAECLSKQPRPDPRIKPLNSLVLPQALCLSSGAAILRRFTSVTLLLSQFLLLSVQFSILNAQEHSISKRTSTKFHAILLACYCFRTFVNIPNT